MAELKYDPCEYNHHLPALMIHKEFNQVYLITDDGRGKNYATLISVDLEDMETTQCNLKDFKPLPKGAKFEFIN